jgi:hypothetical protein
MKRRKILYELKKVFGFEIPLDDMLTGLTIKPQVDIFKLDQEFRYRESNWEYLPEAALYKGKSCSMQEYISLKYGKEVLEKFKQLL